MVVCKVLVVNCQQRVRSTVEGSNSNPELKSQLVYNLKNNGIHAITNIINCMQCKCIKLRRSNRPRAKFWLILWSNCLLIDFLDLIFSSESKSWWQNWDQWLRNPLKRLNLIERDRKWSKEIETVNIYQHFWYKLNFLIF